MKLNGLHFADDAEIQEAVTDGRKKEKKKKKKKGKEVRKDKFSAAFQKRYDRAKARVYAS
jgi:hypothetical protein